MTSEPWSVPTRLAGTVAAVVVLMLLVRTATAEHTPQSVDLVPGSNWVTYNGATLPVWIALGDAGIDVAALWTFNAADQSWALWSRQLPDSLQGFTVLEHGRPYFVIAARAVTWNFFDRDPLAITACVANGLTASLQSAQAAETTVTVFFLRAPVPFATSLPPPLCTAERSVSSADPVSGAVTALLAGPTAQEAQANVASRWSDVLTGESNCDGADFTLAVTDGTATVQFCRSVRLGGVLTDVAMARQMEATLTQFSEITKGIILDVRGDCMFDLSGLNRCLDGAA